MTARQGYLLAIDIGTTSNVVYLVDLLTGKVADSAADYNAQIARGEDIILIAVAVMTHSPETGKDTKMYVKTVP